jgi:cytochrome bd-type quinol oxidase subunit 2
VPAPDRTAERERVAAMFERYGRRAWLWTLPLVVIAVVDLATGYLGAGRRIDLALLGASAMSFYSSFSIRRLGRRFRQPEMPTRATRWAWMRGILSILVTLAAGAGIGYLIGGLVVAVVLPAATAAVMLFSIGLGLRLRRRRKRDELERARLFSNQD